MRAITEAIESTIGKEGKYSNNPHDAGGETMWGITIAVARKNGYTGPMRDMPRSTAVDIYRREYFIKPGFEAVASVSTAIAEELFDTGVNMGVSVPSTFLQRCLNTLNQSHKQMLFEELTVDGMLGAKSVSALAKFIKLRGKEGEVVLLTMLNALQGARYIELAEKREQNEEFIYGWFRARVVI